MEKALTRVLVGAFNQEEVLVGDRLFRDCKFQSLCKFVSSFSQQSAQPSSTWTMGSLQPMVVCSRVTSPDTKKIVEMM